jgi:uncharacterized membrane protein YphA (DoxX/SURF4 family)
MCLASSMAVCRSASILVLLFLLGWYFVPPSISSMRGARCLVLSDLFHASWSMTAVLLDVGLTLETGTAVRLLLLCVYIYNAYPSARMRCSSSEFRVA